MSEFDKRQSVPERKDREIELLIHKTFAIWKKEREAEEEEEEEMKDGHRRRKLKTRGTRSTWGNERKAKDASSQGMVTTCYTRTKKQIAPMAQSQSILANLTPDLTDFSILPEDFQTSPASFQTFLPSLLFRYPHVGSVSPELSGEKDD
ncbi:hypothetical protein RUM44_009349 [Polyplax serrata]|uniref:Uncharacterized protein n=1 Tax=Polyplax serrata TaxID=468196 RepID=A0ABR1ASF3_POLSC